MAAAVESSNQRYYCHSCERNISPTIPVRYYLLPITYVDKDQELQRLVNSLFGHSFAFPFRLLSIAY